MTDTHISGVSRRSFLHSSGSAAIAMPFVLTSVTRAASPGDTLKVGLVGCGGRGTGAASQALSADRNVQLVAMGDVFESSVKRSHAELSSQVPKEKIKVEPDKMFSGLDSYKKVIDSGVDVVLLTAPPGFRPEHFEYAVKAGKHVFAEKPMASDAAGVRRVMDAVAESKRKKLAVVAGFCWRYDYPRRAFYQRIHDGLMGEVRSIYATYLTSPVKPMPPASTRPQGMGDIEWQIRNWYNFVWLSGDGLVEQAIHSVDKIAWAMRDEPPESCVAVGGRAVAAHGGNIYDHIQVNYEWADGTRGFMAQRQSNNCHGENNDYLMGTKGLGYITGRGVYMTGENAWKYSGEKPDMYQVEHNELFASIRAGKPINDGDRMAKSTLMGIMGRMAAYTGAKVTWEMALGSKEQLVPEKATLDMPFDVPGLAIPGKTPFV
ncbi:MAG: Gfo/Idh/MocA family oxidoreductase [Verrucomicrobia bacterium]|nr:Gfo/Idh/MocA family oxidoreductase [Verrucomicrobiota bacterium]